MKKKILLSGSAGFIGSNFVRGIFSCDERVKYCFTSVDKIIAPYNLYNVNDMDKRHSFYMGDIADQHFINNVFKLEKPDIIIHMAAESFVDDSIRDAMPFAHSNMMGTQVMVDAAVKFGVEKLLYVSSDEVFGQLNIGDKSWTEESTTIPRNPYSASKLCGELIVKAAHHTHGLQYNITRCCNNYGPRQPPRNLIPKIITCILNKQPIPIHGSGKQIREWIYVDDHCDAIMKVLGDGKPNETYNVGSGTELTNLEVVEKICDILGEGKIKFIKDRPGHDFRYSVDCTKLKNIGWKANYNFDDGIRKCINWYQENKWYYQDIK